MITEYTILSTNHKKVKEVYVWDHMIWLSRNQLEQIFHVKKPRMETLLDIVDRKKLPLGKHSVVLSIVKQRKQADGKEIREWIHQVRHFDLDILQALLELEPHTAAQDFFNWASAQRKSL